MSKLSHSLLRFAWTLSRLNTKAVVAEVQERRSPQTRQYGHQRTRVTASPPLEAVIAQTVSELSPWLERAFRFGNRIQSGLVDTAQLLLTCVPDPDARLVETWETIDRSGSTALDVPEPKPTRTGSSHGRS